MTQISSPVTSLSDVSTEWLTRVLLASGALLDGAVADFTCQSDERRLSTIAHLALTYAPGSRGACPRRLFLKICATDLEDESFGPSEVHYYTRDYVGVPGVPLLTCYDAVFSAEQASYHLLLDDVSATHGESHGRVPTLAYGLALAEGLARMHAHWWGAERLQAGGEPLPGAAHIQNYVQKARDGLAPMLESVRGQIDESWVAALHDLFANHPSKMVARTGDGNGFTLVHGDANPGNILASFEGDTPVYLVDRQPFDWSLTTWLGVSDLAYMMVHWWDTDVRRRIEMPILRRYHETLLENAVRDYGWEQLILDYRLCVVQSAYVATEWCRNEEDCVEMKWAWFPMLEKAMVAYFDHDCAGLW